MPARTDQAGPEVAAALLLARRGQAFFSRVLTNLGDDELDGPSLLPGWRRRHVVAHVGLNARAVARLVDWAHTGIETPMYDSPTQRDHEIAFGATLPARALRNLSAHAAVHLSVEWRDLPEPAWEHLVTTAQGRTVLASETVWMRTREVWLHAVDLNTGAQVEDFPSELHGLLLADVVRSWQRRADAGEPGLDVGLRPVEAGAELVSVRPNPAVTVRGTAARLTAWATGRGMAGVSTLEGVPVPPAPRWL